MISWMYPGSWESGAADIMSDFVLHGFVVSRSSICWTSKSEVHIPPEEMYKVL